MLASFGAAEMNICIIGKYPPIQGGVSTRTYWLARALGARGHSVYVITNAFEVEPDYRIRLVPDDIDVYQPEGVAVFNTNPFERPKHIPESNLFVSKLASTAIRIITDNDIDVIYADYLEPYGVAGFLAKEATGKPLIVRHAGSDISRLFPDANLHHLYMAILRNCDLVLASPAVAELLGNAGVQNDRIISPPRYSPSPLAFSPETSPVDFEQVIKGYSGEPVIFMYGKGGEVKGSYDIIDIIQHMRTPVRLHYVTNPSTIASLREYSIKRKIERFVTYDTFLSNTRIAQYIRASAITCFLERDFPINIHGPVVPLEVMAVGACLVLSNDIFSRPPYRDHFKDGVHLFVINPHRHAEAAAIIDRILCDKELKVKVGKAAEQRLKGFCSFDKFIDDYERLLCSPLHNKVGC